MQYPITLTFNGTPKQFWIPDEPIQVAGVNGVSPVINFSTTSDGAVTISAVDAQGEKTVSFTSGYQKPEDGIPQSDLSSALSTLINTAYNHANSSHFSRATNVKITSTTFTATSTTASGSTGSATFDPTVSGWYFLGIIGWRASHTGASSTTTYGVTSTAGGTITMRFKNQYSSAITPKYVIQCLYMK